MIRIAALPRAAVGSAICFFLWTAAAGAEPTGKRAAPSKKVTPAEATSDAPKEPVRRATPETKRPAQEAELINVEENEEGVKTYQFGAIEVEGRLKAPQVLYFLRRVRAEFEAGLLGHRSFMLELSDTRRSPALN